MNNRHKWYKEIQAWSEGAEIEYAVANSLNYEWHPLDSVNRFEHRNTNFRIKPQPVEVIAGQPFRFKEKKYLYVYHENGCPIEFRQNNIRSSHDGSGYIGKIEVQDD